MNFASVLAISLIHRLVILAVGKPQRGVPPQFVYDVGVATSKVSHKGCTVTSRDVPTIMDSDGMSGPPWVSYINCSMGASYVTSGVAVHGDFQVWLHYGQLSLDGQLLSHMGESFWVNRGARVKLNISGSAYVAGAKFQLDPSAKEAVFTSSFVGPMHRHYSFAEAKANLQNSTVQDDPHICNGSSPSKDFVFGTHSNVDPASVVVVNCAAGSTPESNFVWSHFHPSGALYMPLSGEICFASKDVLCVSSGTARWTSANLQYYEFFRKINITNSDADAVRDLAGVPEEKCQYPNVFAVTNFDGPSGVPGVPNFVDWPTNAHDNSLALGIGPWGVFKKMTIQTTHVVVKSSTVVMDDESTNLV